MSSSLFIYIPIDGAIMDDNTPTTPIVVNPINVAVYEDILFKHRNSGLEAFIQVLKSLPLRYAIVDTAGLLLPNHIYIKRDITAIKEAILPSTSTRTSSSNLPPPSHPPSNDPEPLKDDNNPPTMDAQGEKHVYNDINSDDDLPLSKKHESAASSSDTVKRRKGPKVLNLSKVFTEWGMYIKDARDLALEHNAATREAIRLRKTYSLLAPKAALVKASMSDPTTIIQLFNTKVAKERITLEQFSQGFFLK
ncbi:unnamed protein product [Lactuca virosa]|uniref:Uncharacterized protein n=1 Tax=Lactuca virosa TaxID=75947 RepID=A0AAU9PN93_9ASTR|nr:unnamed protein product [Lactuca virosa]